jgi:hypothetical protein
MRRAVELRDRFIKVASGGDAHICTYAWAYRYLFNASFSKFSQAFAKKIVSIAKNTPLAELPGLGKVRLDGFVVRRNPRLPGDGHWESAEYEREDWERLLGTARLLHQPSDQLPN